MIEGDWNASNGSTLLPSSSPSSSLPVAPWQLSGPIVSLATLYVFVLGVGLLGNAFIACALLRQRALRNILLLNLCASDFLVCGLSGPVSVVIALHPRLSLGIVACKLIFFLQGVPVAASTLSLMMLSLDRYASIEHPHLLSQLRQSRRLHVLMNTFVWCLAILAYTPLLYSRSLGGSNYQCEEIWPTYTLRVSFTLCHVIVVYLVPGLTVAACHHAVGHKLYAASLVAAAANGDIPLPMPILGRPKEVIIVASVQHDVVPGKMLHFRDDKNGSDDDGDEPEGRIRGTYGNHRNEVEFRQGKGSSNRTQPPGNNRLQQIMGANRPRDHGGPKQKTKPKPKPPLTKQVSRQSLHSRRRLANMLVALVVVFATCWLPYVIIKIYSVDPDANINLIQNLLPFCLLLGHTHSAINPIVYWFLNRQSINITICFGQWWMRNGGGSNSGDNKKGNFRFLPAKNNDRRPSSTNEAALGVFHPRYTVPKPRPKFTQPRESSQYYV